MDSQAFIDYAFASIVGGSIALLAQTAGKLLIFPVMQDQAFVDDRGNALAIPTIDCIAFFTFLADG